MKQGQSRRQFLTGALGTGAAVGLGALVVGCDATPNSVPKALSTPRNDTACAPEPDASTADAAPLDASHADMAQADAACVPTVPDNPPFALEIAVAKLPYRQDDPKWGQELMWDRDLVMQAATQLNGETKAYAQTLMRKFADGNNIANEGCQLTCMAMVLRLLQPDAKPAWTPKILNVTAQEYYYYSACGLSLVPLYADLAADVTGGQVQLALQEQYFAGEADWQPMFAHKSALLRAYRSLTPAQRSQFLAMVKTGTWDDTVASHYVLIHPEDSGGPDDENPLILDPAMPLDQSGPWRLTDSAATITQDPDIAAAWKDSNIQVNQLSGVWIFVRWQPDAGRSMLAPLIAAWAQQLAKLSA